MNDENKTFVLKQPGALPAISSKALCTKVLQKILIFLTVVRESRLES